MFIRFNANRRRFDRRLSLARGLDRIRTRLRAVHGLIRTLIAACTKVRETHLKCAYSYVYSIMRNDGMTKLNVAAAMNISFRNADLFEYDYTNSLTKGLTRR